MSLTGKHYLNGLVHERRNSIANTLELRLSFTNLLIWSSDCWGKKFSIIATLCSEAMWLGPVFCLFSARSKLRLCSTNHRPGYWSNLPCDWLSTAWVYFEQETENRPRSSAHKANNPDNAVMGSSHHNWVSQCPKWCPVLGAPWWVSVWDSQLSWWKHIKCGRTQPAQGLVQCIRGWHGHSRIR